MKIILFFIGVLPCLLYGQSDWVWTREFPWVWDDDTKDWWYVHADNNGKFYTFRNNQSLWYFYDNEVSAWQIVEGQTDSSEQKFGRQIDPVEYEKFTQSIPDLIEYIRIQRERSESDELGLPSTIMALPDDTNYFGYRYIYNWIYDLNPFKDSLAGLTKLSLPNKGVLNITALSNNVELEELDLYENYVSDLTPLSNLVNLENLNLHWNDVIDISPLSNLINLKTLDLSGNEIENLNPLSKLVNLKELSLSDNKIRDLIPLKSLKNLEYLSLDENSFSDLTPLKELTNLKILSSGFEDGSGKLLDFSPLASLPKLEEIGVSYYSHRDGGFHEPSEVQLETIKLALPNVKVNSDWW